MKSPKNTSERAVIKETGIFCVRVKSILGVLALGRKAYKHENSTNSIEMFQKVGMGRFLNAKKDGMGRRSLYGGCDRRR